MATRRLPGSSHFYLAFSLAATLALSACGGGGSTDPHPTAIGTACTLIQPVRIALYGDSTQFGLDSFTHVQAVPSPSEDLQADMDARFGPGAVEVTNYGVSGTTAAAFVRRPADIEVVNYGINDQDYAAGESIDEYEALLRKIASGSPQMVFETPNATPGDNPRFAAYVQRMRDVAASLALPLADVNAYVQTVPAWQTYFADFAHPNAAMYGLIVKNSLAPTLVPLVGALRCE
jgi:lysophospholipase L1-like esterase